MLTNIGDSVLIDLSAGDVVHLVAMDAISKECNYYGGISVAVTFGTPTVDPASIVTYTPVPTPTPRSETPSLPSTTRTIAPTKTPDVGIGGPTATLVLILLSVLGYMVFMQPWLALVGLLLFCPQVLFIPFLQEAINRRTKLRIETLRALSVDIVNEATDQAGVREKTYGRRVADVYRLNMQIFRRKFGMNFLMNLFYQLGIIGILSVGGWLLLHGKTEVGTVVAFISGLNRMNDPWGDLVNYFRDLTNAGVKYRMIASALDKRAAEPV
jgi:ABC-type multidrug transport system fused ATPase/permease subunit